MNIYTFQPDVILRTPAFSYQHFRSFSLQDWLNSAYFLQSIALANKVVYTELSKLGFNAGLLPSKMKRTLRNYINRMHYRCIPFGTFAGFTYLRWQEKEENPIPIVLDDHSDVFLLSDRLKMLQKLGQSFSNDFDTYQYYSNPSFYKGENELRYLRPQLNNEETALHYTITAVKNTKILNWLLEKCNSKITFTKLLHLLMQETGYSEALTKNYLYQLIQNGILLPDLQATQISLINSPLKSIIINRTGPNGNGEIKLPDDNDTHYANTRHNICQGSVALAYQQSIVDGLTACSKLSADHSPDAIRKFKSDLLRKFDQQVVPLLLALDPELGVGYANLEHDATPSDILDGIALPKRDETYKELHWHAVHSLLFDKMQGRSGANCSILLDDSDLDKIRDTEMDLPSGMSVLFRIAEDKIFIESCGGATATAIPGRFSIFDEQIRESTVALAVNEINNNPDVIFAEIDSLQEYHVANLELRATFFDYRINMVTGTGNIQAKNIALSDLWVAIRNDKVILWSKSLRKEVIPRLSTAYNILRSQLNIYRFLCELQYQGIRTHFQLDLSHYFPFLSFYPRVTYKESILSLATWCIGTEQLKKIRSHNQYSSQALVLQEILKQLHCPDTISVGDNDTQLIYKTSNLKDLQHLLENVVNKDQLIIKEFPFLGTYVTDKYQSPFVGQFLATLVHNKEVFKSSNEDLSALIHLHKKERTHPNWLYVKLYCHPSKADEQLRCTLIPFIKKHQSKNHFKKWHFLRYADPDFHIRLRIECHDAFGKANIWLQLNERLEPFQNQGIYADIKTDIYKRELERYYPFDISNIEDFFHWDSNWIASLLNHPIHQDELLYALCSSRLIIESLVTTYKEQADMTHSVFYSLYTEFRGDKTLLQSLLRKYGINRTYIEKKADALLNQLRKMKSFLALYGIMQQIKQQKSEPKQLIVVCTDFVHMHLNRFFSDHPREKEMVVYYFLWRQFSQLHHIHSC